MFALGRASVLEPQGLVGARPPCQRKCATARPQRRPRHDIATRASSESSEGAASSSKAAQSGVLGGNSVLSDLGDGLASQTILTGGLRRTPLSGGVQSATAKYDLPSPAVAVRNLLEQARYGHLCTIMSRLHHRRAGYPFGSLVDFVTDSTGHPIFSLSPLAIHISNVVADPRSSVVVEMPGWRGLANARVTMFGELYQLPKELQPVAKEMFQQKFNPMGNEKQLSGNFVYYRMERISDIYFVGGFGTVQWVDTNQFRTAKTDPIVTRTATSSPEATLLELNGSYGRTLPRLLDAVAGAQKRKLKAAAEEAMFVSIDRLGMDVRVLRGQTINVERLLFPGPVDTAEEAHVRMKELLQQYQIA